jgi:hypothetical protein
MSSRTRQSSSDRRALRQAPPLPRPNAPSLFALVAKTVATRHRLDNNAPPAILKSHRSRPT